MRAFTFTIGLACALSLSALSLTEGAASRGGEADLPDLDPVVASAARWAVAIQVDREEEPPAPRGRGPGRRSQGSNPEVREYRRRPSGPASGMLVDSRGHVLTSHYNVSGTVKRIEVTLPGGVRRPAAIRATSLVDDLALLLVEDLPAGLELPEVKWAEPGRLRVGSMVLVVGRAPDPERPTATFGIVSALGRNGGRVFQTDAELNYGNAGGPIADLDGSVVGLATFISHSGPHSLWGLNSGIGFGTSAETIRDVLPKLMRGEDVQAEFPFLGVGPASRPTPGNRGVLIGTVQENSPAGRGGLLPDDVLLLFDGEEVGDFADVRRQIRRRRPGDAVTLKVLRGAEEIQVRVLLGKWE